MSDIMVLRERLKIQYENPISSGLEVMAKVQVFQN